MSWARAASVALLAFGRGAMPDDIGSLAVGAVEHVGDHHRSLSYGSFCSTQALVQYSRSTDLKHIRQALHQARTASATSSFVMAMGAAPFLCRGTHEGCDTGGAASPCALATRPGSWMAHAGGAAGLACVILAKTSGMTISPLVLVYDLTSSDISFSATGGATRSLMNARPELRATLREDRCCRMQRPPGACGRVRAPAPHRSQMDAGLKPGQYATPPQHSPQTPGHGHWQRQSIDHAIAAVMCHEPLNTPSRCVASPGESAGRPQAATHRANFS